MRLEPSLAAVRTEAYQIEVAVADIVHLAEKSAVESVVVTISEEVVVPCQGCVRFELIMAYIMMSIEHLSANDEDTYRLVLARYP